MAEIIFNSAAIQRQLRVNMAKGIADAMADVNGRTHHALKELGRVFREGIAPDEFAKAHERLARGAQQAIINAYDQTVTRAKTSNSAYRSELTGRNRRYAGGALRRALEHPNFVSADAQGFGIINVKILDEEAAHWARLNFGALPAGRGSRDTYQVRFSNLVVASIGLMEGPRPAFFIPRGYWWKPGEGPYSPSASRKGQDEFYPIGTGPRKRNNPGDNQGRRGGDRRYRSTMRTGRDTQTRASYQRRKPTRGIKARNFLNAGLEYVAEDPREGIGPTYKKLYEDLWKKEVVAQTGRWASDASRFKLGVTGSRRSFL